MESMPPNQHLTAGEDSEAARAFKHPIALTPFALTVDATRFVHGAQQTVNERVYFGFIEHLGRVIYGGILDDPHHPAPQELIQPQDDPARPETSGSIIQFLPRRLRVR